MKILVTGANGFIGKNLIAELENLGYENIYKFTRNSNLNNLKDYLKDCDIIFHLAGVNRSKLECDFVVGNVDLTKFIIMELERYQNNCPIVFTSTIHAENDTAYGISKREAEDIILKHHEITDAPTFVYRLSNLFGKWSKPNYNSVVSTYCYNIARNKEIIIRDANFELELCYIDDVISEFIDIIDGSIDMKLPYMNILESYRIKLGYLADLIYSFRDSRENLFVPDMSDFFIKKLYSTYLSYLELDDFSYDLKMNVDSRGSFTEFLKSNSCGQVSINISKPGVTKGNHWHNTKNEKFLVVSGCGLIKFRNIMDNSVIEYSVSDKKLEVIDIPIGYTHSITNVGMKDLVTIMWVNECYNPVIPDTYHLEV